MKSDLPESRLTVHGDRPVNATGQYVLYWMIANRRADWNYSLDRAIDWAEELGKPLLVLEALRSDYPWASERLHRFVIDGMIENAAAFAKAGVAYHAYLEPKPGEGAGLLKTLAEQACVVVSDDFPCFFLPAMLRAARRQVPVRFELVDSNGIYPMRATSRVFNRAYDFRRHLQKTLPPHLHEAPRPDPFTGSKSLKPYQLPTEFLRRWPAADLQAAAQDLAAFPIDHTVHATGERGGAGAAKTRLEAFLAQRLPIYDDKRNQPEEKASSELSPYLHFGHVSAHEIFSRAAEREDWTPAQISDKSNGSSSGWWGGSDTFEAFLDELITWREVGYNRCALTSDFDRYESLPDWAQKTLAEHADDPRQYVYSLDEFEGGATHDKLWNAAQRQLVREGRIHNYLRMLWGKKILEWSATPRDALAVMLELNNRYALDGRNPNSYSGIFWVLGRYDRAWGPERPIFGKIRYMSSDNTARKVRVKNYIAKHGEGERSLFD